MVVYVMDMMGVTGMINMMEVIEGMYVMEVEVDNHLLLQSASFLLTWLTFSRKLFLEVLRTSL